MSNDKTSNYGIPFLCVIIFCTIGLFYNSIWVNSWSSWSNSWTISCNFNRFGKNFKYIK